MAASKAVAGTTSAEETVEDTEDMVADLVEDMVTAVSCSFCLAFTSKGIAVLFIGDPMGLTVYRLAQKRW